MQNLTIRNICLYGLIPMALLICSFFYPNYTPKQEETLPAGDQSKVLPENKNGEGDIKDKKTNSADYNNNSNSGDGLGNVIPPTEQLSTLPPTSTDSIKKPLPMIIKKVATNPSKRKIYYEPTERSNSYYENSTTAKKAKLEELKREIESLKPQKNETAENTEKEEKIVIPTMIPISEVQKESRFFTSNNKNLSTKSPVLNLNAKNVVALAEIMETKRVRNNTSIRIKLLESIQFGNNTIPSGAYLTGICTFINGGDRLSISLNSLVINSNYVPIAGNVLDMDGTAGVQIYGMQEQIGKNSVLSRVAQGSSSSTAPLYFMGSQSGSVGTQIVGQVVGGVASQTLNAGQSLLASNLSKLYADVNVGHRVYISINSK